MPIASEGSEAHMSTIDFKKAYRDLLRMNTALVVMSILLLIFLFGLYHFFILNGVAAGIGLVSLAVSILLSAWSLRNILKLRSELKKKLAEFSKPTSEPAPFRYIGDDKENKEIY